ncbi:outer membrane beta-barrel protein [Bacteroidota bacterium]
MSKGDQIRKGGLADKISSFTPEPPEVVWENISSQIQRGNSRKILFTLLSAAAGLALAITIGVTFLSDKPVEEFAIHSVEEEINQNTIIEKGEIVGNKETEPAQTQSFLSESKINSAPHKVLLPQKKERDRLEDKVIEAMKDVIDKEQYKDEVIVAMADIDETTQYSEPLIENKAAKEEVYVKQEMNEDSLIQLLGADPEDEIIPDPIKIKEKGKWQIGAAVSPQISYRDVGSADMLQNSVVNNSESARMTYTGGIQLSYKQSKRLTIESGVYYNKMGVNIGDYYSARNGFFTEKEYTDIAGSETLVSVANSMGTIVTESASQVFSNYREVAVEPDFNEIDNEGFPLNTIQNTFSQSFEYLEVPFNLRYKILDKAFKIQLVGGLSTNFLISNSVLEITDTEKLNIGQVQDIRSINYSGNAGVGFVYEFLGNFSLSVEPRFRYYLNSINLNNLPSTRPYTFGLYTGVNYTF